MTAGQNRRSPVFHPMPSSNPPSFGLPRRPPPSPGRAVLNPPRRAPGRRNLLGVLGILGVLTATTGLVGCANSPVAANATRSPYERYDNLRGRDVPRTRVDSFGRERLNLEGRLGEAGQGE